MSHQEIVNNLLVEYFEVDSSLIKDEARIKEDLGFDSLDAVDMLVTLEEKLKQRIGADEFINCKTVGDIYSVVERKLNLNNNNCA